MSVYEDNIIPIKLSQLAEYVSKTKHISPDEALVYIYVNPMYERLYDEKAKWWYLSTPALYDEFEFWRNKSTHSITKEVFEFYTYCLETFALHEQVGGLQAWALFKENGIDEYIINNYDLLHTQGTEYIIDEIHRFIRRRRK